MVRVRVRVRPFSRSREVRFCTRPPNPETCKRRVEKEFTAGSIATASGTGGDPDGGGQLPTVPDDC